jgi:DNA-binding transcriptional LysR family regulator
MRKVNFDLDALRTFSAGVELGSFARAALRVGRSTSAVSAQLKKLEEQAGAALFRKAGRGLALTDEGELLLSYAHRMLELNDEAWLALAGTRLSGAVRLGLPEDFGEHMLSDVLARFARSHPAVRIEARAARNLALLEQMQAGELDLALAWHAGVATAHMEQLGQHALHWIGPAERTLLRWTPGQEPLPLVMLDGQCVMRRAATDALDRAGVAWRLAFTSPGLGGVWAAVGAGLGVTVRTRFGLGPRLRLMTAAADGLPRLGQIGLALHQADAELPPVAAKLRAILLDSLAGQLAAAA